MEQNENERIEIPDHHLNFLNMPKQSFYKILVVVNKYVEKNKLDKDACHEVVKHLNNMPEMEEIGEFMRARKMAVLYWKVPFGFAFPRCWDYRIF